MNRTCTDCGKLETKRDKLVVVGRSLLCWRCEDQGKTSGRLRFQDSGGGNEQMEMINLIGKHVASPVVQLTYMALADLMAEHPVAFYESVAVARDPQHKPWGNTGETLAALGLVDTSGKMHGDVRTVICASVTPGMDPKTMALLPLKEVVEMWKEQKQ
jgi:hypothetical protein